MKPGDLFKFLPKLTSSQLGELKVRISALLSNEGLAPKPPELYGFGTDIQDDWLFHGIVFELTSRGLGNAIPPYSILQGTRHYKKYEENSLRLRKMLQSHIPNMSRGEQRLLGQLVMQCHAKRLSKWTTVSLVMMLRHVNEVPEAIEDAFPGYLRSGLLGMVLRNRRVIRGMDQ